ncbi:acyl-CoA carboxylase subunit epsilon [Streptomyces sp. M10(2022)]
MIKVVRGNPTPEELAAALAVVRRVPRPWPPCRRAGRYRPSSGRTGPHRPAGRPQPGPRSWARTYWPA